MYIKIMRVAHGWIVAVSDHSTALLDIGCDIYAFSNKIDLQDFLDGAFLEIAEKLLPEFED